jgi:hypothetical protein
VIFVVSAENLFVCVDSAMKAVRADVVFVLSTENLFAWVKSAMKDVRDEMEFLPVRDICARVLDIFHEAGEDRRAFRWAWRCGYGDA